MRNIILGLILAATTLSAQAKINLDSVKSQFFEGTNLSIKGTKLEPTVTLTTIDGQVFTLTGVVNGKATKLNLQLPLVSADSKVKLTFTDTKGNSETLNAVVYNDPTLANGGVDLFANATVLPASVESGLNSGPQGDTGEAGEDGETGAPGPAGPPGPVPTAIPGTNILGTVGSAQTVVNPTQAAITTLPSLVSAGTTAVTTNFLGPVATTEGFAGNLTGNVTGNADTSTNFTGALAGDITGTQAATVLAPSVLFAKQLEAGYAAAAGTIAVADSLVTAIAKLDGNTNTNTTAIGTPSNTNTANQIVKRDAVGDFAASNITANLIGNVTGNLSGNVTGNVTGDVTGNSDTATNFTTALAGDITGLQGATVLSEAILFAKQLEAGYAATTGVVSVGTTLLDTIQILDGNIADTVSKTSANAGAITVNSGAITSLSTTNTAQDTAIANAQTDATDAIADAANAQTSADDAQADVDALTAVASIDITGVDTFSAADTAVVVLTAATATLNTITGGVDGQRLLIIFTDVATVTDDNLTANGIDLVGTPTNLTTAANDTLELVYTGGAWLETSRSTGH